MMPFEMNAVKMQQEQKRLDELNKQKAEAKGRTRCQAAGGCRKEAQDGPGKAAG